MGCYLAYLELKGYKDLLSVLQFNKFQNVGFAGIV